MNETKENTHVKQKGALSQMMLSCSALTAAAVLALDKHSTVENPLLQQFLALFLLFIFLILFNFFIQSWARIPQNCCNTTKLCEFC